MAVKSTGAKSTTQKPKAFKASVAKSGKSVKGQRAGKAAKATAAVAPTARRSMQVAGTAAKKRKAVSATRSVAKPADVEATVVVRPAKMASAEMAHSTLDSALPQAWLEPWTQVSAATARMLSQDAFTAAVERNMHFCQTMARLSPLHLTLQMVQGLLPAAPR